MKMRHWIITFFSKLNWYIIIFFSSDSESSISFLTNSNIYEVLGLRKRIPKLIITCIWISFQLNRWDFNDTGKMVPIASSVSLELWLSFTNIWNMSFGIDVYFTISWYSFTCFYTDGRLLRKRRSTMRILNICALNNAFTLRYLIKGLKWITWNLYHNPTLNPFVYLSTIKFLSPMHVLKHSRVNLKRIFLEEFWNV